MPPRPHLWQPSPGTRRAVVIGAGSFGTPTAVLLAVSHDPAGPHAGPGRASRARPRAPRVPARGRAPARAPHRVDRRRPERADYVFLGVPSHGLDEVIGGLEPARLGRRTPVMSLAKGLVPPERLAPTTLLSNALGASRVAGVGGPAHAREMVTEGAGLVAGSVDSPLAAMIAAAPVTTALNRLIAGELPLEEGVAQVRAAVPAPARFDSGAAWRRWWWRLRMRMRQRPA